MAFMSVTPDRSGVSVAAYVMAEADLNALSMLVHPMSPHWSMDCSFCAFATRVEAMAIFWRPPVMETVWSPAEAYSCVWEPVTSSSVVPSPQSIVYVPVPGMGYALIV